MQKDASEHALRHKAEALRGVIQRIECTFVATGETGAGWGKRNSRLVQVEFYPVVGDSLAFRAGPESPIHAGRAHSRM
jgi:hypothetical protein